MGARDIGHELTEARLAKLERRIAGIYSKAARELSGTIDEYFAKFKIRDEEMRAKLDAGEITQERYTQWRLAQMGRGDRFKALQNEVAERYSKANEVAIAYTNDETPSIYSLNRNYAAYTIEQVSGNVGFTLWDEQTAKRLIAEEPELMPYYPPKRALKRGIDLAYGKQQISAAVTSGILQGKSIGKIANDLQTHMVNMERSSAIRTARTAVTSAQNAGRMDSYIAAEKMGIKLKREWVATLDNRTRHAHAMLDGQKAELDKPFKVDGYSIMFPGDTSAPGYLVYNCRCTIVADIEGIDTSDTQRWSNDGVIPDMTYQEWVESKKTVASTAKDGIIERENIVIGKSLGAARKSVEVLLPDGSASKLTEGTEITDITVFAGAGTKTPLRVKNFLAQNYGGRSELWQHVKGHGYVDTEEGSKKAMLHWFEEESVGIVEMKVKGWSKT